MRSKQYINNLPSNDWFNFTTTDNDVGKDETVPPAVSMNLSHLIRKSASPPQEEGEETHLMNQKWTWKRIFITASITLALVGTLIGGIMAGLSSRTNHYDHQTIHNNSKCQAPISYLGNGKCDLMYNTTECNFDHGDCLPSFIPKYPNCTVDNWSWIQDNYCDGYPYNSLECGYDGGDCRIKDYPHCINIEEFDWLGDGQCDEKYNTLECGYDLGDCSEFNALYPDCTVDNVRLVGDGYCNGGAFNVEECGFDGGDCLEFNQKYGSDCNIEFPYFLADDECDGGAYNTIECNYDGGDCIEFNTQYRNCIVDNPYLVGNDVCDGPLYNTTECKFDGGDCIGDVNTGVVDDDDNFNDVAV
ncbi:hypothetical protein CTEN210_18195 [Chaetoceros tenuissimus]|uniref:LNR domain-containing protein n=1 Tax=Chaetoceros tenuissimus TaxID=426638 RepID=A0AAD3DC29_9STRA|nr:hypothetical protein CTEN210_18195 [Chaetoceros tenuissimus]